MYKQSISLNEYFRFYETMNDEDKMKFFGIPYSQSNNSLKYE